MRAIVGSPHEVRFLLLDLPEISRQLLSLVVAGKGFADGASGIGCLDIYLGVCHSI